MKNKNAFLRS
uniref:Truncated Nla_18150 protein n=1 Tax=Neisseria lactamica TaxID=486 RepID=R4NSU9_NEILA|nr:truncated Nla_18150 protein [Neisseria lactamica]